ncbi:MAG: hypothetical protein ACUVQ6_00040 [Dissulfurimicrobium sp.]|uniref:hypothetical protein n=1 Tax=Dissulfurimicrobium sp. TaxID=2022436 RepID=UPI00404B691E
MKKPFILSLTVLTVLMAMAFSCESWAGVAFSDGTTKLIAVSIDINGTTITLRDTSTSLPLWAGYNGRR